MNREDSDVDIELLADIGYIAQRLRSLEKLWNIELKELQRQSLNGFGKPPIPNSQSLREKLNEFNQLNDHYQGRHSPELNNQLKQLEDTVIKIYHQQELTKKQKRPKTNKKVHIKSTMNYSAKQNQSEENNSSSDILRISENENIDVELNSSNNSNVGSGCAGDENINPCDEMNRDNNKIIIGSNRNDTDDKDKENQFRLHQLQQQNLYQKITNNELKMLIKELKRKVDYTEKMNWLCLSNRPIEPPSRKTSLPKHSEVKKKFLEMCNVTLSDDIKAALRLPSFDSYDWHDWEILHLMETMFVELKLIEKFQISISTLREWLYEVYKHYNDVPFHNFRHCFCVSQMMYAMAWHANLIEKLGELDVLILLISCICHDLDHPGYNNIYQINARTELALRYNDISPLENHHCSIAFRLLEHPDCNVFENMNKEIYKEIREGIIRCILATDMARHNEIITQFREVTPIFDYSNKSHKNLLCMVLIKVADISNEARPMDVAEPWLDRLLQEFFAQSAAEKLEGLPVTPFMDPEKVSKPGSQVRFIGLVLLPLFEALGDLLTELVDFIIVPVRKALDYYKRLNEQTMRTRKSLAELEGCSDGDNLDNITRSHSGISMKSKRSIPSQKSTSRNSVDEPILIAAELHDLPEGSESGDSETATEVDVAEKASKFKVDTESRSKINHNQYRHQKNNRDKRPSMVSEICTSGGRMRGSYGNIHYGVNRGAFGANRAISLDQCGNRRMSDGIQTVTSDSSVYYNNNQTINHQHSQSRQPPTTMTSSDIVLLTANSSNSGNGNTTDETMNNLMTGSDQHRVQHNHNCNLINNNNNNNANTTLNSNNNNNLANSSMKAKAQNSNCSNSSANSTKSLLTRLKNLTGRLTFSFDKDTRRLSNASTIPLKATTATLYTNYGQQQVVTVAPPSPSQKVGNNNATNCFNLNPVAIDLTKRLSNDMTGANTARGRAFSLDVPTTKYNFSSGASSNDGSRKSLSSTKNDESFGEDTNSNYTDNSMFICRKRGSGVDTIDGVDI